MKVKNLLSLELKEILLMLADCILISSSQEASDQVAKALDGIMMCFLLGYRNLTR